MIRNAAASRARKDRIHPRHRDFVPLHTRTHTHTLHTYTHTYLAGILEGLAISYHHSRPSSTTTLLFLRTRGLRGDGGGLWVACSKAWWIATLPAAATTRRQWTRRVRRWWSKVKGSRRTGVKEQKTNRREDENGPKNDNFKDEKILHSVIRYSFIKGRILNSFFVSVDLIESLTLKWCLLHRIVRAYKGYAKGCNYSDKTRLIKYANYICRVNKPLLLFLSQKYFTKSS